MWLVIDIGTGSARAGIVDAGGVLRALESEPHMTSYPQHGWVEQAPLDWWRGTVSVVRRLLDSWPGPAPIEALACCGQMHAPVLIDRRGELATPRVPLWNDKRAFATARRLNARIAAGELPPQVNPATPAWPGVKLHHAIKDGSGLPSQAATLLMPKDWINFRLTGKCAMDWTEAGSSFLADRTARAWSPELVAELAIPVRLLPPILPPDSVLGPLLESPARALGLMPGLPVVTGAGDFPAAMLGSDVVAPGQVSDVTGTSFLLTEVRTDPLVHPAVMNVALASGGWGSFAVVDAGGEALRWAAATLSGAGPHDIVAHLEAAARIAPGSEGVVFLPYLTGERLGAGTTANGAFVGLTAAHGPAHLVRAVLEGVAMAMRAAFRPIAAKPGPIVATAGAARSDVWLKIKAEILETEVATCAENEAGLIGGAALAMSATGAASDVILAARSLVRPGIVYPLPETSGCEVNARQARFDRLRDLMLSGQLA